MKAQTSSQSDQVKKSPAKWKINPLHFFLGFIGISFIAAFIIGGIILGRNKSNKQLASTEIKEQVKLNSSQLPDSPGMWTTYQIESAGIELKLPESLAKKGDWKSLEIPGEKGSIVCFSSQKQEGSTCAGGFFVIGGTSADYEVGREGMFTDFQGFNKEGNKYFVKTIGNNTFELKNAKFKEIKNSNGVELLKILGENTDFEGNKIPLGGTPGEGYLGAIINTKNNKYPGIAVQLNLESEVSEFEFDQILESIKFTN